MNALANITLSKLSLSDRLPQIFEYLFRALLWILPFHVLISVFVEHKLWLSLFTLYKEGMLAVMAAIIIWRVITKKLTLKLEWLDWAILAYMGYLIFITLWYPFPLEHIIYGGRYNFEFLGAFLILRFGAGLLQQRFAYYLRILVISASAALVLGILVRWIFGEQILVHFGFSAFLSNWNFGGSIPIYHGIEGANVRRFQGIFDGPNPAGFFILLYLGLLATYFRSAKKYYYLLSLWVCVLVLVLLYTYSRSAVLGLLGGGIAMGLVLARTLYTHHRKLVLSLIPILFILGGAFYLKFEGTIHTIILREGSTKGHYDRAVTGIKRAIDRPQGSGLASAGPAYRFVKQPEEGESLFEGANKVSEDYYIPESWFIQQAVEGGIIGFGLFVFIFCSIALGLARTNIPLFGSFIGIGVMNCFLHSYESLYISLLLFMIVGLVLSKNRSIHHV
jgi:hypothetical protein